MDKNTEQYYLTSKEAKKVLKVSDCKLSHLRLEGKLPFIKKGNAFFYEEKFVKNSKKDNK